MRWSRISLGCHSKVNHGYDKYENSWKKNQPWIGYLYWFKPTSCNREHDLEHDFLHEGEHQKARSRARFFARGKAPKSTILCTKENTQNNVCPKYNEMFFWLLQLLGRTQHMYDDYTIWQKGLMVAKLYGIPSWEKVGVSNNKWGFNHHKLGSNPNNRDFAKKWWRSKLGYQWIHRSLLV